MFGKPALIALSLLASFLVAAASVPASAAPQPPAPTHWAKACKQWDDWSKPGPPFRIDANTYYVGTCGISAILIVGDQGSILIDGGPADAAGLIARNITALGVPLTKVRILLSTHEHFDHAGGLAELKRLTGARLLASPAAAQALERGGPSPDDPQFADHGTFPKVAVDGLVHDGEVIRLGRLAITAHATPGHTSGATSWTWRSCEGSRCSSIAYVDSLSQVSSTGYRFAGHASRLAAFRRSIAVVSALPCDILLTPHPSQSDMIERAAAGSMIGGPSCKSHAADLAKALNARLAKEAGDR